MVSFSFEKFHVIRARPTDFSSTTSWPLTGGGILTISDVERCYMTYIFRGKAAMTQSTRPISLSSSEQSTGAAGTERASESVSNPGGGGAGGKASVPSIIHELYRAPTLYLGEDPVLFDRLLEDLAHALAPADLMQWFLVADLAAVILDEGRFRKMLALIMSPKELIELAASEQETQSDLQGQARTIYIRRRVNDFVKAEERDRIWDEIVEEVRNQHEAEYALAKTNAPELERRASVSNFQNYSREVERLDYLIERCRKTRTGILSRLEAMKVVSSSLHRPADIEDVEFTEAAE